MSYKTLYHHHFPHCLSALVFCCSSFGSLCSWHIVSGLALGYHAQFCLRAFALTVSSTCNVPKISVSLASSSSLSLFRNDSFSEKPQFLKKLQQLGALHPLPCLSLFFSMCSRVTHYIYLLLCLFIACLPQLEWMFNHSRDSYLFFYWSFICA